MFKMSGTLEKDLMDFIAKEIIGKAKKNAIEAEKNAIEAEKNRIDSRFEILDL